MSRIKLYKCFEHWQKTGNIIIFSDPHWGDSDRSLMGYNFTEEEQCKAILAGTRSGDTLICLGDVGVPTYMDYIKRRRNHLHTVLIMGNHDQSAKKFESYFDEIYEGAVFIAPRILLSHEPMLNEFYFNIHGHSHSGPGIDYNLAKELGPTSARKSIGYNLCPNIWGLKPINLNNEVNGGLLKGIPDIHRVTIDNADFLKRGKRVNINPIDIDKGIEFQKKMLENAPMLQYCVDNNYYRMSSEEEAQAIINRISELPLTTYINGIGDVDLVENK